jgi:hypothetical protein
LIQRNAASEAKESEQISKAKGLPGLIYRLLNFAAALLLIEFF